MALFRSLGSRHNLRDTSFFSTTTWLDHPVCRLVKFLQNPDLTFLSSVCCNLSLREWGILLGGLITGWWLLCNVMWYLPSLPSPVKKWGIFITSVITVLSMALLEFDIHAWSGLILHSYWVQELGGHQQVWHKSLSMMDWHNLACHMSADNSMWLYGHASIGC